MSLTLTAICVAALCLLIAMRIKRTRDQDEIEQHSITPEALHTLLASNHEVLVFDVRQPLDLLADPEIIVGAKRIPPKTCWRIQPSSRKRRTRSFTVPVPMIKPAVLFRGELWPCISCGSNF